jgi:hypothetical protein
MRLSQRRSLRAFLALTIAAQMLAVSFVSTSAQTSRKRRPKVVYYSVPANQTIRVRLNQEVNSEKARVGDTFTSTVVDPVYSSSGVLVVPQGSTVTGVVNGVQRAQKNGKPATMDVSFTSIRLPNGRRVAISGSLTDLSTSNSSSDNEGTVSANKTSKRKLKFIGGGAAGGAVIGAIAGGGKGLAIGAGVGALTGAITGRVKKGHEVKVKSGTEFGVILNRSFALPKYAGA